jgi:hypothetical protein
MQVPFVGHCIVEILARVESTAIKRRQQQEGRMADFSPPIIFSVFDL